MLIGVVGDMHIQESSPRSRKDDYFTQCLIELSHIFETNDVILLLGDVFHRSTINDECKQRLMDVFLKHRKEGKKIYSLVGNHDINNMNLNSLKKSSLGVLAKPGLLKIIGSTQVGPLLVDSIEMKRNPVVPKTDFHPSILLGHVFFENSFDPKLSIERKQLMECGYDYVILGHDHEPYPPMTFGKTTLLRPGSLCRNTSHLYNLQRQPQYVRFSLEVDRIVDVKLVEVPAPKPEEIFFEAAFKKPEKNTLTFMANVEEILKGFQRIAVNPERFTLRKALDDVKAPEPVKEYIKRLHERALLNYS